MPETGLHRLARMGLVGQIKQAIESGAEIDRRDDLGQTPLHAAIARKRLAVASLLIQMGADVSAQDADGMTPPQWAIEHRLFDLAWKLVTRDPRVLQIEDKHGNQPLWTAVFDASG